MRAIAISNEFNIGHTPELIEQDIPRPIVRNRNMLVEVHAFSVNPVDIKLRSAKQNPDEAPRVPGFDAAGIVRKVGSNVTRFKPGDRVFYAGDINKQGSYAQYQRIDERLVAPMPRSLDFTQAAALPLVSITAWELLFERMPFDPEQGGQDKTILIIGGAGGVGSMATQLAKYAGFTVICTASRPESKSWCHKMGADYIIDHNKEMAPQINELGFEHVDVILNASRTSGYWEEQGQLLAPQGRLGLIVDPTGEVHIGGAYKKKCISIHWEYMFARSLFNTDDIEEQSKILEKIAALIDDKTIKPIDNQAIIPIKAENVEKAHDQIAAGHTVGKLVMSGW